MADVLYRTTADLAVRATASERVIFGTVVPYGETITVDDGRGPFKERFEYLAFQKSVAQRSHKVRLLQQHDQRGRLPIGRASLLEERPDGLYGEFTVAKTRDGDDALALAESGCVDFSVGFRSIRDRRDTDGTVVRVEAAIHEASLVGSPAYSGAVVAGVRSASLPYSAEADLLALDLLLQRFQ